MKKSIVGASRAPVAALALLCLLVSTAQARAAADPLPSWNEGTAKQAIVKFVATTTTEGSPQFVSPGARFATFDQDGTTWVEHPIYTQVVFALDRVVALAPKHPEWKTTEPFKSVIAGDRQMLEYTQAASNGALMMLVLHDDPTREYADGPAEGLPASNVGTFTQALYDEAKAKGRNVISMKKDWKRIFSFDK